MTHLLPSLIFWTAAIAVVVGQVMILRSTARAWRASETAVPFAEKIFAWGPTIALAAVLWFSWQAANAPPTIQIDVPASTQTPLQGIQL